MDLFKLVGKIVIDNDGANSAIDSTISKVSGLANGIGGTLSKVGGVAGTAVKAVGTAAVAVGKTVAAGAAAGATALGALTKQSVDAYADYEQLVGGVETLFEDLSYDVIQYADEAYKTAGLSANDYMETVTSFAASLNQSLIRLNGNIAMSADMANMAIIDMSDNANKMGTSMSMIQNAYQGFAKQNYTMLDNLKLGYGGTQAEMYRLMSDAKKLDETFDAEFSLSAKGTLEAEFADIIEAIHIVQENMGITGATADEAASTISGSLAMTKAAWKNLLVGIADPEQDMGKLTENLITSIVKAAENIIPRAGEIIQGIGGAFSELAPMIGESFQEHITPMIGDALSQALDVVGIEISGEEITKKLNSAFSNVANDVGKGLSTVQQVISDNKEEISTLASEITELLSGIGTSAKEALSDVDWSAVFGGLLEVSGTVVGEANDIWTEFEKAGEKIKAAFDGTDWGEVFYGLKEAAKEAIEGLGDIGAESVAAAGNIVAEFSEALNAVVDSAQTEGTIANKITEFLKGQFTKGIDGLHLTADVIEAMFDDSVDIDGGEIIHQILERAFSSPSSMTQSAGLASAAGLISSEIVTAVKNAFNNPEVDQLAEDFSGRIKAALTGDPYPTPKLDFSPAIDAAKSAWASIVSMFSGGISVPVTYVVSEEKTTTPGQSTGRTTPRGNQILVRDESTITMASDSDVEKRKQAAINQANAEAANKKAAEAAAAEYAKNKANTSNTKKNAKGAILNRATIFGKVGETYQIGGEAGAEAVAPIETLQNYVSTAVAEVMAGQNAATAEAFAMSANAIVTRLETLADEIAEAMGRTRISINGREFGRLVREV